MYVQTNLPKSIKIKEYDNCGVHPSMDDFRPIFTKEKRGYTLKLYGGKYKSSKHNHSADSYVLDFKRSGIGGKNIFILVKIEMSRFSRGVPFVNGYYTGYFLVGYENGKLFNLRLPDNGYKTVQDALEYIEPAEVRKAKEKKKKVFRMGDVFFVETKRKSIFDEYLPSDIDIKDDLTVVTEHDSFKLPHEHFKVVFSKGS